VELTEDCRKLHNEEIHDLHPSSDIILVIKARRISWRVHVVRAGEKRNAYSILVGKHESKRRFGRPRPKWDDNINRIPSKSVGRLKIGTRDWLL
jgi:hypothetical protein